MSLPYSRPIWLLACALACVPAAHAQVSLTTLGTPHTQSFDTLPASGSATFSNNVTLPGWFHARTGTGTTVVANDGASNAGNLYSYGTGTAADRALGSLGSGNAAVGNLFWGIRLQNNTGATITSLEVSYTGEQWRNSAAAAQTIAFSHLTGAPTVTGSLAEFQTAGTAVAALNFTSPITGGTAGALNGNLAANRVSLSATITGLSIPNGTEIMLRWSDPDQTGADHGLSIDDFSVTPQGGGPPAVNLSINDVTQTEGNAGITNFVFTVSLSAPAGPGGVTFDIATADGTAQDGNPLGEDNDYVASALTGQTIPAGSSTYAFTVQVNGDTTAEPGETFFVNVTNVTGATVTDGQGQGTILNDDVTLTPIHDIQGPGASSPIVGSSVTTRGIVTGVRSNGFFIQTADAEVDADPATSQGILVFTSSAPPAAAAVGNLVQVTGTVVEFVPAQDPLQPPLTEITTPTVSLISGGNPLPAAIPLTTTFPSPAGPHDQLERLEGMRVSVPSLTVVAPTTGSINEPNATATSNGVFQGVITGNPRAFREAGIQAPDPAPAGSIPPIPRYDSNPEVIRVDSDNLTGTIAVDVRVGQVVTGLTGPLDYTFRRYTVLPESAPGVAGTLAPTATLPAVTGEVTIASYNLQRFYDDQNDPAIGEPVLTAVAYDRRLGKASLGIRDFLGTPDIVGVVEVENLSTLQALAARISSDALAAGQPDPQYVAYLVEGNDVGGIDVGFLVKTAPVAPLNGPRVSVNAVVQELATTQFVNLDSSTELLNDRPPLRLDATVSNGSGQTWPVQVIVNHLRSLNDSANPAAGSNGWATVGDRVRAKRQAQAVDLATLVQTRQTSNPAEHLVLIGDFNAFEVNDGLAHTLATVSGTPVPDNQTAVPGDGTDLVTPDLTLLTSGEPAAQRYSFVFDGNAQVLDHAFVNAAVISGTAARRVERARINADFPDVERGNANALRLADHDPLVLYLSPNGFQTTDVSISLTDSVDPVVAGTPLTYTLTAANLSTTPAGTVNWSLPLAAGRTFMALSNPAGWSCTTPAVGASGTVNCAISSLAPAASDVFSLQVLVGAGNAAGSVLNATATISTVTLESATANNSDTESTTVSTSADLGVVIADSADPVNAGAGYSYQIDVVNTGPSDAASVSLSVPLPAGTTFAALTPAGGWSCTPPTVGTNGTVTCTLGTLFAGDTGTFTVTVNVDAGVVSGTVLSATATLSSTTTDPASGNNSDTETTGVGAAADLSVTLADSADPVNAGTGYAYTLNVANAGPSAASAISLSLPLPSGTTFTSATTAAGWNCTTPAVGANGTLSCTLASFAAGGSGVFTVNVNVDAGVAGGTILSATASISTATSDPVSGNNSDTETTGVDSATDIGLSLTATPDPVTAGTQLTLTGTVSNAGPIPASGVVVSLTLPVGTSFVSGTVAGGGSCALNGAAVDCSYSGPVNVGAGNARAATVLLDVAASVPAASTLTFSATASTANTDPNPANNTGSTTVGVIAEANLASSVSLTPTTITQGGTVSVTARLQNLGPSDAQDAQLAVVLPAGLQFIDTLLPGGGSCTQTLGNPTIVTCVWSGATAPGSSRVVAIAVRAVGGVGAPIQATASALTSDPVSNNNQASVQLVVLGLQVQIPVGGPLGAALLVLLLAGVGGRALRRRGG